VAGVPYDPAAEASEEDMNVEGGEEASPAGDADSEA
jgi:hypothetical protein